MRFGVLLLLLVVVGLSGLAVGIVRNEVRRVDLAIQTYQDRVRSLESEWSRLQLERAALASQSRVERLARKHFGMYSPPSDVIWNFRP